MANRGSTGLLATLAGTRFSANQGKGISHGRAWCPSVSQLVSQSGIDRKSLGTFGLHKFYGACPSRGCKLSKLQ
jgi:hypothetical protein